MRRFLSTVPTLLLLCAVVLIWTAGQTSAQLIQLGESIWPGYALHLRNPRPPVATPTQTTAVPSGDDDLINDLLGEDDASTGSNSGADDALIDDLLGDLGDAPSDDGSGADEALIDDLLGDLPSDDPPTPAASGADDALIDDLLSDLPPAPDSDASGTGADDALIDDLLGDVDLGAPTQTPEAAPPIIEAPPIPEETAAVRAFRAVDRGLSALATWGGGRMKQLLVLLMIICGATATATRHHISLRPVQQRRDDQIAEGLQFIGNLGLAATCVLQFRLQEQAGLEIAHRELPLLWATGLGLMALLNVVNITRPRGERGGSMSGALLAVPLYTIMSFVTLTYFLLVEQYPAGPAVYLMKLTEHAQMYFFIGLYVWIGMMLKRTKVVGIGFDVLRPWKMPPELLVAIVVAAAAIPTAYSGASGIFVIAVGGVIYQELRTAGARNQLALAATAMSGSLGVVLSPCLLVVIVAYLNPVTTTTLYGWGRWVFLLTAGLFAAVVLLTRQNPLTVAPAATAGPESLKRARPLGVYVVVFVLLALGYRFLLDARLDEQSAPMILPVIMGAWLLLEHRRDRTRPKLLGQLDTATKEATVHIGALLLLMGLSIAFGGVFERSEVMSLFPAELGSPVLAMALLVVALVVIGMMMDPYGAVILVSVTLADVATQNGIAPAHFWMVVLVAFELGYLTPPVALNHLLTRQVVGEAAMEVTEGSFWARNERILLPLVVMATALLIVAFVPLAFSS